MAIESTQSRDSMPGQQDRGALRAKAFGRRFPQIFLMLWVYAVCLFVPAGDLDFREAWVYLGLSLAGVVTVGLWVGWHHPEVILERSRVGKNTKGWDKVWSVAYAIASLGLFVVAGLDHRFGWSSVTVWLKLIGGAGLLASLGVAFWAMASNPFLATTVRIQDERGHRVATTGPYALVRHPMYAGMLLSYATAPLLLDALPAYAVSVLAVGLVVLRTALEDSTLQRELDGYRDYAARTRFRLVPGVW